MSGEARQGRYTAADIERLEALIELIRGGSGGGSSFAGPIVNRLTATSPTTGSTLESQVAVNGEQFFVLTNRSIWTKINGVAGTVGVPPLAPMEVIAATDGSGVFARTTYSDPAWRIGVNDMFIDPANPAANDENPGFTAALPLKTGYELHRRRGWDDSKPIVGPNLATSPAGFSNINVMSDIVAPDSLPIKVTIAKNSQLRVLGNTPTVIRSAVLTNAVVAMNPAAPVGGTRLQIRDNTLANWTAFMVPNRRVRMIDGPAAGGTLQPQTNQAGGAVDCSPCQTTNEAGFSIVPTTVTPAVGNTYHVEQLTVVNFGEIDVDQELNDAFVADTFFNIDNVDLPSVGNQSWAPKGSTGVFINFYQCVFDRSMDTTQAQVLCIACYFGAVAISTAGGIGIQGILQGGGANGDIASGGPGSILQIILDGVARFESLADFNFTSNRGLNFAVGVIRNASFWNAIALGGVNAGGHGLVVGGGPAGGAFFGMRGDLIFHGLVWGNSTVASARGLLVTAGCDGLGAPQNITGPNGDFKLADRTTGWFFDAAAAVYNPAAGALAFSWANLAAAQAAGFGGDAHNPVSDCHFVPLETSA